MDGQVVPAAFGQDQAADALPPGPLLASLADQAVEGAGSLTDDELVGVLHAARRLANHAAWQQTVVIAEFARRRQAAFEAARDAGIPVGCRPGEFPGGELAMELTDTDAYAGARIDTAIELTGRLPRTLAGMQAGVVDLDRACTIAARTAVMTDEDAAYADQVLAAAAPDLRPDQLGRKAAALELKLAPDAVKARKELARQLDQRVEARREQSGNASLSGRELDTADVIASKAHIDAIAVKLRDSGVIEGNLGRLRALALTDLTQGRDPLERLKPTPVPPDHHPAADQSKAADSSQAGDPSQTSDPSRDGEPPGAGGPPAGQPGPGGAQPGRAPGEPGEPGCDFGAGPARAGDPAPLPALINLLVPAGTLVGWGTAPGQAAGWGLLDPDETQALVWAASRHPRTRWCMTVVGSDGTAVAHGCAGQHPWPGTGPHPPPSPPNPLPAPGSPPANTSDAPTGPSDARDTPTGSSPARSTSTGPTPAPGTRTGPGDAVAPDQAARLADLLRRLNITLEPIARDTCDHRHAENRYVPSRKLKHLLRARHQTCTAPACNNQAAYSDLDHTVAYPDGPTDQCNLTPKCRRHHRTKQAPGWNSTQPTPDTTTWTTPSGRTHTTRATTYDL